MGCLLWGFLKIDHIIITVCELRSTLCTKTPLYVRIDSYIKQIPLEHLSYIRQMPLEHLSYIKETSWNIRNVHKSGTEFTHCDNGTTLYMELSKQLHAELCHCIKVVIFSNMANDLWWQCGNNAGQSFSCVNSYQSAYLMCDYAHQYCGINTTYITVSSGPFY